MSGKIGRPGILAVTVLAMCASAVVAAMAVPSSAGRGKSAAGSERENRTVGAESTAERKIVAASDNSVSVADEVDSYSDDVDVDTSSQAAKPVISADELYKMEKNCTDNFGSVRGKYIFESYSYTNESGSDNVYSFEAEFRLNVPEKELYLTQKEITFDDIYELFDSENEPTYSYSADTLHPEILRISDGEQLAVIYDDSREYTSELVKDLPDKRVYYQLEPLKGHYYVDQPSEWLVGLESEKYLGRECMRIGYHIEGGNDIRALIDLDTGVLMWFCEISPDGGIARAMKVTEIEFGCGIEPCVIPDFSGYSKYEAKYGGNG